MEDLLALPLDVAMTRIEAAGRRCEAVPYGPPRTTDLAIADPRDWRVVQVRTGDVPAAAAATAAAPPESGTVVLIVVPAGEVAVRLSVRK